MKHDTGPIYYSLPEHSRLGVGACSPSQGGGRAPQA